MADALCGPSNALQSFQKQTSVDRTLQQDRIAARQAQAESFRSTPGPNAGILDAEFEAFQTGRPFVDGSLEPQLFTPSGPPSSFHPKIQHPRPALPDWATDFQNLNLNHTGASPIPQSHFRQYAPLQHSNSDRWHEDFSRQQKQPASLRAQQHNEGWAYGFHGGFMPQHGVGLSSAAQQKQPESLADDVYDEAAFERAFETAGSNFSTKQQDTQLDQDLYRTEDVGKKLMSPEAEDWFENSPLSSDLIADKALDDKTQDQSEHDADELARTAGQLLENVQGDQSKKFQESNFLSLMRQLRDKEVRVEGDKLVDVSMSSSI